MESVSIWDSFEETRETSIPIVDITQDSVGEERALYVSVHDLFWKEANEIANTLLTTDSIVVHANSLGKDSSATLLIVLEAYRIAKRKNPFFNKPLIINTIDTLIEELPVKMYADYTIPQIEAYAQKEGINLVYNRISPSTFNSWSMRYLGARKLFNNATRTSDCTDILKLAPVRQQIASDRETYGIYKFIMTTGSRVSESVRRSTNMSKASTKTRTIEDVNTALLDDSVKSITYAPIRNWTFEQVFALLRISGTDPLVSNSYHDPIPSFQPHGGLLIEIYGDASTPDTCQINIADDGDDMSGTCGSSNASRMGCTFCTVVSDNKSAENFVTKKRWSSLHMQDALRIRDWIWRLSINPQYRAFHARAIDPVFNRVMLQPNLIKPRLLEKLYALICQLTADSEETAYRIAHGGVRNFEGYKCIQEDEAMPEKTKQEFLAMYSKAILEPQYRLVTKQDAIMLSFMWALDGVGTFPYAPIGIYDEVFEKNRRVSKPKLNSEIYPKPKLRSTVVDDAFVLRTMSKQFEQNGYLDEQITDVYPYQDSWLMDTEQHCPSTLIKPKHTLSLQIEYYLEQTNHDNTMSLTLSGITIMQSNKKYGIERFKAIEDELYAACIGDLVGQLPTSVTQHLVIEGDRLSFDSSLTTSALEILSGFLEKPLQAKLQMRNLKLGRLHGLPKTRQRKSKMPHLRESTKRFRRNGEFTNTRLKFYQPRIQSNLTRRTESAAQLVEPSASMIQEIDINEHDQYSFDELPLDSIYLDTEIFWLYWEDLDGYERACRKYREARERYIHVAKKFKKRSSKFEGLAVVRSMMGHGGITLSPNYVREFRRIYHRTFILQQIRAYDYQCMSSSQIAKHVDGNELLTMKTHRTDKALHLLKIRKLRNKDRVNQKCALDITKNGLVDRLVDEVIKPKIDGFADALIEGTDTMVSTFLNQFYIEQRTNYLSFEREFLTTEERNLLHSNVSAHLQVVEYYDQRFQASSKVEVVTKNVSAKDQASIFASLI